MMTSQVLSTGMIVFNTRTTAAFILTDSVSAA